VSLRRTGVLLLNLGTPDSPRTRDVRRYLREFLSDPRVLDLPAPLRALLLYGAILPFRPRRSAAAYRQIWTPAGSPLLVHGRALAEGVARALGDDFRVELAMRYGRPSIAQGVAALRAAGVGRLVALPLFPQYSAAATGSAVAKLLEELARGWDVPPVTVASPFYDEPRFIAAFAAAAADLAGFRADHVLMSFHGLPERQIRRSEPLPGHCLASPGCCDDARAVAGGCYRAQCFATARALARALELPEGDWSASFQSRLGRTPWIAPYTDEVMPQLAARGVKRLAVLCPAFVADCLETLEEIGIRARDQWHALGGDALWVAPCPNAHPRWVEAVSGLVRECAGG
jgi:ferrochelatase